MINELAPKSRACIDDMVAKGWLLRQGSLLTHSEGSYFNYYLNQVEFSDGPNLRNKYLHGSQAGSDDKRQHFATYTTALKLLIALVIKMNDEFWLRDEERKRTAGNAGGSALLIPWFLDRVSGDSAFRPADIPVSAHVSTPDLSPCSLVSFPARDARLSNPGPIGLDLT